MQEASVVNRFTGETQLAPANPNLIVPVTFSYKDILVKKIVRAVACSIISQLIILLIYVIIAKVQIFHPIQWFTAVLNTFTYIGTWIFGTIFSLIIFTQCVICAKDFVFMKTYCSTRFQQFLHIFSFHNFTLLSLHVVIGGAFVWQILAVIDTANNGLTTVCESDRSCVIEDNFFLIIGGFWTGFYFFLKVYISSKHFQFPVIQKKKFLEFRSYIVPLFKDSFKLSFWPTVYFALLYYSWGAKLEERFVSIVNLGWLRRDGSILIYLYMWWFSSLYFFSMNLIRFFFYLFLTETVQFPLIKETAYILTLQEAFLMKTLPIVQHLACLDLWLLAQWSPLRRQMLFTLSQPGGHPYNWNALTENILKLFAEYTDLLKMSTTGSSSLPVVKPNEILFSPFASPLQSPVSPYVKYRNLRNMSCHNDYLDVVNVTHSAPSATFESIKKDGNIVLQRAVSLLKTFLGINFLFGELPQVNIQKCLGNGQLIVWASEGICELAVASLIEDRYGIVQKDLPSIITALVHLKQSLDTLNKVPELARKIAATDDFNYKMKNSVNAAVKRSLFKICLHFGEYFNVFPLNAEVLQYLQNTVMPRIGSKT